MDPESRVSEQWVRDIRAWLETQPGATEFDGSPLDGVQRVMSIKDQRIAELKTQLAEARAAARWFYADRLTCVSVQAINLERWPWLADEAGDGV
jgi:hypothetical protein